MPQVPYSPIPQPGQMIGTPKVSVNTPVAAFGGAIGQAFQGLGKQFEQSGDEIFHRAVALQELRNETDAKNADAEYMKQSVQMLSDFKTLQGQAASPDALRKHIEGLDSLRTNIREGLSNDAARRMFDSPSLSFMGREAINAGIHAAQQQKTAANNASIARVDMFKQDALNNPTDDVSFQRATNAIKGEIDAQADIGGWNEAQKADQKNKAISSAWAHRIVGLARTEPYKAQELLDQNRDYLHPNDIDRVERTVETQVRNVGSRNIDNEVNADLRDQLNPSRPEKTITERVAEARQKAEKLRPDDVQFADMSEQRTRSTYEKHKKDIQDFEQRNLQTVAGALNGDNGGKVPTTIEELQADPKVGAAYDALSETRKMSINKILAKNAKGDVFESPDTIRRYLTLRGMRQSDPQRFMEIDPAAENIPFAQRREIGKMQQDLKKNAEMDPRVRGALETLRPNLLDPIGLTHAKDEEGYNRFVGALQDALEEYQEETKKRPDYKKTLEIGQRLLQEHVTKPGYIWDTREKVYNFETPEDAAIAIKADPKWAEQGIDITKDTPENKAMIQRTYVGARYKELYGGKDKSAKDQSKK